MPLIFSSDILHLKRTFQAFDIFYLHLKFLQNLMICVQGNHLGFADFSPLGKHKNSEVFGYISEVFHYF